MKFFLRISVLLLLVTGTLTQDGFDLYDAIDHDAATTEKPKPKTTEKPKINGGGGSFGDSDLLEVGGGGGDYKPDANGGGGAHPDQDSHGAADQPQDPDLLWGQILKMLNANMPEEFFMWISNVKQMLTPLLERAMNLLQAMP